MKKLLASIFFLSSFLFPNQSSACNLSDLSLISVVPSGPNWLITVRLCIGRGRTGSTNGADNSTKSIAFGFYDQGPVSIIGFTPASITSPFPSCNMVGSDIGPSVPLNNTDATLLYSYNAAAPGCSTAYACIVSTALCGNAAVQCINFGFTLSVIPDSIRAFGVEANGALLAGCTPNVDMAIAFGPLPVSWGNISATPENASSVAVVWECVTQVNNDFFTVQRYDLENHLWNDIANVDGAGNSNLLTKYSFVDTKPIFGNSYYRIKQTDYDGRSSTSPLVEVYLESREIVLYPMPFYDEFTLFTEVNMPVGAQIEIYNYQGGIVKSFPAEVYKSKIIEAYELPSGIYFLIYRTSEVVVTKRLIKY